MVSEGRATLGLQLALRRIFCADFRTNLSTPLLRRKEKGIYNQAMMMPYRILGRELPKRVPAATLVHLPVARRVISEGVEGEIVGMAEDGLSERVETVLYVRTRALHLAACVPTIFLDSRQKACAHCFLFFWHVSVSSFAFFFLGLVPIIATCSFFPG